jgi:hypothetical protein
MDVGILLEVKARQAVGDRSRLLGGRRVVEIHEGGAADLVSQDGEVLTNRRHVEWCRGPRRGWRRVGHGHILIVQDTAAGRWRRLAGVDSVGFEPGTAFLTSLPER